VSNTDVKIILLAALAVGLAMMTTQYVSAVTITGGNGGVGGAGQAGGVGTNGGTCTTPGCNANGTPANGANGANANGSNVRCNYNFVTHHLVCVTS
jgi:hypothetical protein